MFKIAQKKRKTKNNPPNKGNIQTDSAVADKYMTFPAGIK